MTRVLVTGAAGFLGTHLIDELCRLGYRVRALLHDANRPSSFLSEVETVAVDLRDPKPIRELTLGCEAIVHLAAKVHAIDELSQEQDYQSVNVDGTRHLINAALASGVPRLIFVSSVKVYGEETHGCADESLAPAPVTFYGRSKWQAEQLVAEYTDRHGFAGISLRLPMVYGPTKKGNLYRMIEAIDRGRFPILPRLSTVRSLLHVRNFVQAAVLCLRSSRFSRAAYTVTDAEPYCVSDMYDWLRHGLGKPQPRWRIPLWALQAGACCGDLLQTVSGRSMPLTTDRLKKLVSSAWYSSHAIAHDLGYHPTHSFQDEVPDLIRFYRSTSPLCS